MEQIKGFEENGCLLIVIESIKFNILSSFCLFYSQMYFNNTNVTTEQCCITSILNQYIFIAESLEVKNEQKPLLNFCFL